MPERPRQQVDVAPVAVTGRTISVAANGDLQAAIDAAKPGDAIALEPGATYRGPFRLPRKDGDGWIVIAPRSERGLPPPNQRVNPSQAKAMSGSLAASGDAVIETDEGAHHYRLVGLEIAPADGVFLRALVQIGAHEKDAAALPHHIVIDRCYLHGDPQQGTRRGVALNGRDSAVVNSYFADFKEVGADSQAIAGWNGAGPFKIANNYLEASGENVMFGGADPTIPDLVPADIEVIGNQLSKPLRWKEGHPSFEGTAWTVKNLFELKNARRVLVDGNLMEYNWPHGQNGFAILFTVRNQDGGAPWSADRRRHLREQRRAARRGGHEPARARRHPPQPAGASASRSSTTSSSTSAGVWGRGRLFQLLDGVEDVTIEHNTAAPRRRDHLGRRSHAAPRVRVPEQHRDGQRRRYRRRWHRQRAADARSLFPRRRRAPQRHRRRQRRSLSARQLLPGLARARSASSEHSRRTCGSRRRARSKAPAPTSAIWALMSRRCTRSARSGRPGREVSSLHHDLRRLLAVASCSLAYVYVGYPLVRVAARAALAACTHGSCAVRADGHRDRRRAQRSGPHCRASRQPARARLSAREAGDPARIRRIDGRDRRARARYESAGVAVRAFHRRRGKSAVVNDVVPAARGDIVVIG